LLASGNYEDVQFEHVQSVLRITREMILWWGEELRAKLGEGGKVVIP
jgi:hypothetical protein